MPLDGSNAALTLGPNQADLSKMPFITGGMLFFVLDGVDYVASDDYPYVINLLLLAVHCVQNGTEDFQKISCA